MRFEPPLFLLCDPFRVLLNSFLVELSTCDKFFVLVANVWAFEIRPIHFSRQVF